MRIAYIVAGAAALLPIVAEGQSAGAFMANPSFRDPPPATCVSSFDMQHCAAHDLRVADAAMTRAYFAARDRLHGTARTRLLTDQRRWLDYRDAHCSRAGDRYAGGTAAPVIFAQCLVAQTRARTIALQNRR